MILKMSTKTQVTESLKEKLPIKIGFIRVNHKKSDSSFTIRLFSKNLNIWEISFEDYVEMEQK